MHADGIRPHVEHRTKERWGPELVGVVMGSGSDWHIMRHARDILLKLGIPHEAMVLSAHRTPDAMLGYARMAEERGLEVIIAGAGGAAHLPGMIASSTDLPVIGVPIPLQHLQGMDSLLSIVQMPRGVPVATMAIGEAGAINAALLAARIVARAHPEYRQAVAAYRAQLAMDAEPKTIQDGLTT